MTKLEEKLIQLGYGGVFVDNDNNIYYTKQTKRIVLDFKCEKIITSYLRLPSLEIDNQKQIKKIQQAFNKLSNLEYLEEQLGCPLEVVFKALKEGILINNKKWWLPSCQLVYMKIDDEYAFVCESYCYRLKDYDKTWWLA